MTKQKHKDNSASNQGPRETAAGLQMPGGSHEDNALGSKVNPHTQDDLQQLHETKNLRQGILHPANDQTHRLSDRGGNNNDKS